VSATRVAALVGLIEFELFYDYNCPFVYRAAEMLESVRESGERQVEGARVGLTVNQGLFGHGSSVILAR